PWGGRRSLFSSEWRPVAAAPSLALGPRRRSLLGFGRILIYRNVGDPIAVESAYRVDARKLAGLLIDCDRHALRQEGAILPCRTHFVERIEAEPELNRRYRTILRR